MSNINLAQEGFRAATSYDERVYEAAKLFGSGRNPSNKYQQAVLNEAFSTSDFPELLSRAFSQQALKAQQQAEPEFDALLANLEAPDFEPQRLVDLWADEAFELVPEGSEYKAGTLKTFSDKTHKADKHGRAYGLTWELRLRSQFNDLANFPQYLASGSVRGKNNAVADVLIDNGGAWNSELFEDVKATPLNADNLNEAITELATRENHRGELVDTSKLAIVYGPALRAQVQQLLNADELEVEDTSGTRKTRARVANPFRNLVTPIESRSIGKRLTAKTGWALVQLGTSDVPTILHTTIPGTQNLDIRVERNQGQYVSGGQVPVDQGSFNDDTIWFRGRDVWGIDAGFKSGVWASTGA